MQDQIIPKFLAWLNEHRSRLLQRGVGFVITLPQDQTDLSFAYSDFDTAEHVARITIWDSGLCDMEMLKINDGSMILWQHHEFRDWSEAEKAINDFELNLVTR